MKDRNLLLLSLSGVRIRNPDLLKLGLTLPGFVERGKTIAELPTLSLLTLAGHTPPNWNIRYHELDEFTIHDLNTLLSLAPDLVAISSLTARIIEAYQIADFFRKEGLTVVLGGLHVTALPDEAQLHADSIIIGEGESAWGTLIRDLEDGHLKPRYDSKVAGSYPFLPDSPIPRYDLLIPERYNRIPLQTTRGCPLACHFCAASRTLSSYKKKPLSLVRRELEAICSIWPRPFIELADDNTFVDKAWGHQLLALLKEFNIRWFTETDISVADDEVFLSNLSNSGCIQLLIGLESSTSISLNNLDHHNWKQKRFQNYPEHISKIQSHGVSVNGCLILGHDQDTSEIFEHTFQFIQESELSEVQITILTPFPATPLHQKLKQEGRLLKEIFWNECTLFDVTYQPALMSASDLEQGFRWLMSKTYHPVQTKFRKAKFQECIRKLHHHHQTHSKPQYA